ncbi:MAG: arylsulfatase [Actinobacteria bacterium]|nr:arylsulfatase [Actinomycetota bacterium]
MTDDPTPPGFPRSDFPPTGSSEPYAGFEGVVTDRIAGSESWWPPRPTPPTGAPNVVVVLCDDLGFSDIGCFGSEIETPNLDLLAEEGIRLANFNVTPMCSPSRASLLTGMNTGHRVGVGHVAHSDPGFSGYAMELADDAATMPEILRDGAGYATFAVGKWHLAKDSDLSDAGPKHSWPLGKGFERYYGFLDGFTNFHHPHRLVRDNTTVEVDRYPDGYYLTDDLTSQAIALIGSARAANPTKPFLLYLAHGAVHAPLQAPAELIAKYADRYQVGWDAIRTTRHRRALELGVVPPGTELPPRNSEPGYEAPPWDQLGDDERTVFARYMAVYAAMVETIDVSLGRLRGALEELDEWENTLLVFTSDNGASREGGLTGTTTYFTHLGGEVEVSRDLARLDLIGGPQTVSHYPQGWAMACNTPYRLYKLNTHQGGRHVPAIVSWPARWRDQAGSIRWQYAHLSDVLPTVLDVVGVDAPRERGGAPLQPIAGHVMTPWLDDPSVDSTHREHVFEVQGNRAYLRDNWEIVSLHQPLAAFDDSEWELYDLSEDPTEIRDLAAEHADLVTELSRAWDEAAWREQIYPMDEGSGLKFMIRPDRDEVFERPAVLPFFTPTLERWRSLQFILFRSCRATVSWPGSTGDGDGDGGAGGGAGYRPGDAGYLIAHGDQGGGYGLYVSDGRLTFVHNDGHGSLRHLDGGELADGVTEIVLHLDRPAGGTWTVRLEVGGAEVARDEGFRPLFPMAPFQGIEAGINRRSPVSWGIYERHGSYRWTGAPGVVRYEAFEPAPDAPFHYLEDIRRIAMQYD